MKKTSFYIILAALMTLPASSANAATLAQINNRLIGTPRDKLIEKFGEDNLRSYQITGDDSSITFVVEGTALPTPVTFYLSQGFVSDFQINDREEMAKQYMSEFASGNILHAYPKVRIALLNALQKLPLKMYLEITDRQRPIIFLDYYTEGIAKYAGSMEFRMRETDPPTFEDGFYIIRLGDKLNDTENPEAIEGVILHEIMHRVKEHLRNDTQQPCELEKEANQLLKELGFEKEFSLASAEFGSKKQGDSPCTDALREKEKELKAGTPTP